MKKAIITILIALMSVIALSQTPQYVNGYYRSNGTYVQGYYRTKANHTIRDNYSTKGNVNPYSGKSGTKTNFRYKQSIKYNNSNR